MEQVQVYGLGNTTMPPQRQAGMAKQRALLTATEREQITGEHGDQRRYEATSRVRRRIQDELRTDIEVLANQHPDLLEELQEVVCNGDSDD